MAFFKVKVLSDCLEESGCVDLISYSVVKSLGKTAALIFADQVRQTLYMQQVNLPELWMSLENV